MSLGLTRDSILDLTKLAHHDDNDNADRYMKKSTSFTMKHCTDDQFNSNNKGTEDDFLFLDDMEQETKVDPGRKDVLSEDDDLFSVNSQTSKSSRGSNYEEAVPDAYAGFAFDYNEYGDYYSDPYAPTSDLDIAKKNNTQNIFCCLFAPWLSKKINDKDDHDALLEDGTMGNSVNSKSGYETQTQKQQLRSRMENEASDGFEEEKKCHQDELGNDDDTDDGALSDTDAYGKKMTDRDRKAVLARLRLSEPSPPPIPSTNEPDEHTGNTTPASILDKVKSPPPTAFIGAGVQIHSLSIEQTKPQQNSVEAKTDSGSSATSTESSSSAPPMTPAPKLPKKGILKVTSTKSISPELASNADNKNNSKDGARRALFPKYESKSGPRGHEDPTSPKSTTSSNTAAVNNVNFAPMARVITINTHHNMSFAEKSRVWFQRSDYDEFKKTGRIIARAMLEGGSEIWLTTSNAWGKRTNQQSKGENQADTDYDRALQKYTKTSTNGAVVGSAQAPGETPTETQDDFGNKWWCKFGHSRRGLEHIASSEEGQQRQRNVNAAIRAVMDEQRRQRLGHIKNSQKLATIAVQYTSWARDLALAAGKADAEAVQTNFNADAKCRIHHLKEHLTGKSTSCTNTSNDLATGRWHGIIGASSSNMISSRRLDANTASSMKLKQQQQKMRQAQLDNIKSVNKQQPQNGTTSGSDDVIEEAIHDPDSTCENMAKKAAGFGIGEDAKDMSTILTGMGV